MLVVNLPAAGQGEKKFWCQKIKVQPHSVYELVARMRTVAMQTQSSRSRWTIEGTVFSKTFDPAGAWKTFTSKWKSKGQSEIELCGLNIEQNAESGDLAVDDIALVKCP